jgi:hypothetical protein
MTRPDPFLLFFALSNKLFIFNQLYQLVFVFKLHLNLFRPITELARHSSLDARSFPPFFAFSFLSLLAKLWDPVVSTILFSRGQSGLKDKSQPDAPPHPCLPNPRSPRSYKSCDFPFPLLPLSPAWPPAAAAAAAASPPRIASPSLLSRPCCCSQHHHRRRPTIPQGTLGPVLPEPRVATTSTASPCSCSRRSRPPCASLPCCLCPCASPEHHCQSPARPCLAPVPVRVSRALLPAPLHARALPLSRARYQSRAATTVRHQDVVAPLHVLALPSATPCLPLCAALAPACFPPCRPPPG